MTKHFMQPGAYQQVKCIHGTAISLPGFNLCGTRASSLSSVSMEWHNMLNIGRVNTSSNWDFIATLHPLCCLHLSFETSESFSPQRHTLLPLLGSIRLPSDDWFLFLVKTLVTLKVSSPEKRNPLQWLATHRPTQQPACAHTFVAIAWQTARGQYNLMNSSQNWWPSWKLTVLRTH